MKKTVKKRTSIKKRKSLKRKSVKGGGPKKRTVKGTVTGTPEEGTPEEGTPVEGTSVKKRTTFKEGDKKECPLCFEYITDDDEITLSCTHTFHKTCMTSTCNMPQFHNKTKCICPLCRGQLTVKELATLGIYFNTITEFKEYVNTKLEAKYSRTPSVALGVLKNVLEEFIGTPPSYFISGKILEFHLKNRLQNPENRELEYTYKFEKKLQEREKFEIWYKYFQLQSYGGPMVKRVYEFPDNEDSD